MQSFLKKIIKKLFYNDIILQVLILPAAFVINIYYKIGKNNLPKTTNLLKKTGLYKIFNFLVKEHFDQRLVRKNFLEGKNKNCLIFLLHGKNSLTIFENTLISLKNSRVFIDKIAYCDKESEFLFNNICNKYQVRLTPMDINFFKSKKHYFKHGTKIFNNITKYKWKLILETFSYGYDNVIYSDIDIVFFRDFVPYINEVSKKYRCGIQSEALPSYPVNCCTGFMYFNKSAKNLLKKLFEVNNKYLFKGNDQDAFNYVYRNSSKISKEFYVLPDSLFQCGLLYKTHLNKNFLSLVEELKPYFFHANFVFGINNKIKLFKFLSLWFLNKKNY
jgi:hypothetical protein